MSETGDEKNNDWIVVDHGIEYSSSISIDNMSWSGIPITTDISTITIGGDGSSYFNITNDSIIWTGDFPPLKEFEDHFPEIGKVKEMCEIYPGLKKAYEHFKSVYEMTKDDYEERKNND